MCLCRDCFVILGIDSDLLCKSSVGTWHLGNTVSAAAYMKTSVVYFQ